MESPATPADAEAATLATPEGDNEGLPEEPLAPSDGVIERPRGNEPHFMQPIRKALE